MSISLWIAVALVGGLAATLRFLVDGTVARRLGRDFPFGTLIVNLSGAFALGILSGAALSSDAMLVAGTATIGSYTTFSTWMFESHRLAEDGDVRAATINVLFSLVAGVGAAALGRTIGGAL